MLHCSLPNVIIDVYVSTAVAHIEPRAHLDCINLLHKTTGAQVFHIVFDRTEWDSVDKYS